MTTKSRNVGRFSTSGNHSIQSPSHKSAAEVSIVPSHTYFSGQNSSSSELPTTTTMMLSGSPSRQ
jgi:hypothetical protein